MTALGAHIGLWTVRHRWTVILVMLLLKFDRDSGR